MSSTTIRITALASGNGSNFQAIIDALPTFPVPTTIVRLVANRKTARCLARAAAADIPTLYHNLVGSGFVPKGSPTTPAAREAYDAALAQLVLADAPDLVVLAGWMHVLSPAFLRPLDAAGVRCINLHPALPGAYDGAGAIERAYADFQAGKLEGNKTGIMIHNVIAEVDRGAPIMIHEIECREGETLEQLEERIHAAEHELIVKATKQVVSEISAAKSS